MRAIDTTKPLTSREVECLVCVAEGMDAQEIGQRLGITKRTVETHIANSKRKLKTKNRVSTVVRAMRLGLLY